MIAVEFLMLKPESTDMKNFMSSVGDMSFMLNRLSMYKIENIVIEKGANPLALFICIAEDNCSPDILADGIPHSIIFAYQGEIANNT